MTLPAPDVAVDAVARAVLACPGVAALSAGRAGEVATYLPGRRVAGVRVGDGTVSVHVVGRYGPTCADIAAQVRQAVRAVLGDVPVEVVIDDLELPAPSAAARRTTLRPPAS